MLVGLIVGAVSGLVQFYMLARFTRAITGGGFDKKAVLLGACQFFLPLAVLLGCAFLLPATLLWAAIGMTSALIICAVVRHVLSNK